MLSPDGRISDWAFLLCELNTTKDTVTLLSECCVKFAYQLTCQLAALCAPETRKCIKLRKPD